MEAHKSDYDIGMIGLGVMGRNMLLNLADHGFRCAGYDKDREKTAQLRKEAGDAPVAASDAIDEFTHMLHPPRKIILLVPAGHIVDAVIDDLLPHVEPGDLIIDAGNSYFKDTAIRSRKLNAKGIEYMGIGVSGGEEGARSGACIMAGGTAELYEAMRPFFEAAAAKAEDGAFCTAFVGRGEAGHFVKMVHNGIEYAVMQLIAETYDLMKRGLSMNEDELCDLYAEWNGRELHSYLVEITSRIFAHVDEKTGARLIDRILDVARQKGTGMWASQNAMELHVPAPAIDTAVSMRDLSGLVAERIEAEHTLIGSVQAFEGDRSEFLPRLEHALYLGMIVSYTQGLHLLSQASTSYDYGLSLEAITGIWRGGCIIRAALLDDLRSAVREGAPVSNVLFNQAIAEKIRFYDDDLRAVVAAASEMHIPIPGFMSVLSYLDSLRSAWLPANLIQAQRDFFGAHTYERVDAKGTFHTEWNR
ncbi:MAG TPA: NADP-dependent phosphogluconate dehydrogenase [Bacteroidota bacterium]|nr:NADP-dependent phosphogluconate dehydrogenase [Bacteroidota bacterium]